MLIVLVNFSWSLCCLSFLDLRILITPLVSSNSSYWPILLCEFSFFLTGETFLAMINPCSDKVLVCPSKCTIKQEVTRIILESTHCDYCDCNSNTKTGIYISILNTILTSLHCDYCDVFNIILNFKNCDYYFCYRNTITGIH